MEGLEVEALSYEISDEPKLIGLKMILVICEACLVIFDSSADGHICSLKGLWWSRDQAILRQMMGWR